MIDRSDPVWFKDAVVYQLHIKAYYDANGDGIGDFAGLMQKLDYVRELGVTAIWLLPFYPSPLRDDGYDIADYRNVHPSYGRMGDFRRLVRAAHERGLRVITELVINHTSDQHPWFQRARRAKPGSAARNFYVWSDDDQKYQDTRIIFLDTESSNWAWDPVARTHYWHRFYSHQPDLNFDNPRVVKEVLSVLRFWLDMGVDGLRLDAVPYLCEREGTNNENLPETHDILKRIRAHVDDRYSDRMLLAEANQWPEDVQEYFGGGDECHMAFHFPLMPRMYMAIAQEDRHPITDIMRQTPEIPDACQWAIFLRNHDELTLEMVTDQERDYMWNFYASDRRMRINLGIRRRLAPLMDNDRQKIQLLNGLLLSMPGTPIIYYGDEIGMGDNIYLGDRDGVRTPMQWTPDRNGGFSGCDPERLYLPPIMDAIYGFEAVNVEAQQRSPSSLLNWMKRLIAVRQAHRAFGRGTLSFLYPGNRKVLAYVRETDDEAILCVANVSRAAQAVELDLSRFRGRVPIELMGQSHFPPIGELPYLLTLSSYGFHWFLLAEEAQLPRWHQPIPEAMPEFVTLVAREGWRDIARGRAAEELTRELLPTYLPKHRWFAAKDEAIAKTRIGPVATLDGGKAGYMLTQVDVDLAPSGTTQRYFMPLALSFDPNAIATGSPLLPFALAKARRGPKVGTIYDAAADPEFALAVFEAIRSGVETDATDGRVSFSGTSRLEGLAPAGDLTVRSLGVEQSNSSILIENFAILKVYRRLASGTHPEIEVGRFLTEVAEYRNTPPLLGVVEHVSDGGEATALAVLQGFVVNQGDGWGYTFDYLERSLEGARLKVDGGDMPPVADRHAAYLAQAETLGRRTAELHRALATETEDPSFKAEPIRQKDLKAWRASARKLARSAFAAVKASSRRLAPDCAASAEALLARRAECLRRIDDLTGRPVRAARTRIHGDYHLGQVIVVQDDFYIVDFEGEPIRSLAERRAKTSPAKDVAGMLRSFDYAAWATLHALAGRIPDDDGHLLALARDWRDAASAAFLRSYGETVAGCPSWPEDGDEARRLLELFMLEKAFYEISYEASNRPDWLAIPIEGVLAIMDGRTKFDDLVQ